MRISSKFFVIGFLFVILKNDLAIASVSLVKSNENLAFTVFIGAHMTHHNDVETEIIREVIGIGAIIGRSQVLTTEEYMRWYNQPNIEYFVHVGSHDFDVGGQEVRISDVKKPPQNVKSGPHTLVLLIFKGFLTDAFGTAKLGIHNKFLSAGTKVDMIGIFQRDKVQLAWSEEIVLSNTNCSEILNIRTNTDERFKHFGTHMCLVSNNMVRVDCKSHIGTIVVVREGTESYLAGIKSELHQSCSTVPYIIKFQRVTPVIEWLHQNIQ